MKHDVFISHASEDKSVADAICRKLESADLKCWQASRDLSPGENPSEVTRKAIECSRVIVLVLSQNARTAHRISREVAHAFDTQRGIIPFRLGETLPWREILFYLCKVPSCDAADPPTEEDLAALTTRVKELIVVAGNTSNASPPQSEKDKQKPESFSLSNSWLSALIASRQQALGILKWIGVATFFSAVVLFLWFVLHQTTEWASMAKNHRQSIDHGFSLAPTPWPQARGDALDSKPTPTVPRFGLWQAADGSPTPFVQGSQESGSSAPAGRSADATNSPRLDATPGGRTGDLASEPHSRHVPTVARRVSRDRHPQFPGTQVKEARRIADLENQRDSLRSQLKDTEANLLESQKKADLLTGERDELQVQLRASEQKTQIAQKNAATEAKELDQLRSQLKETENRALAAQNNERLVRTQLDALQIQLAETQGEAQAAQTNADLVSRQRDTLQRELDELKERAQLAETNANLAASQRDAMEAELKKREEEAALEKRLRQNLHGADFAASAGNAPDTQFQEIRQRPAHEDAELAQTLPPNPGQNAKPAPLTQTLDSFVRPTQ